MAKRESKIPTRRRPSNQTGRTRRIVHGLLLIFAGVVLIDAMVGDGGLVAIRRARQAQQNVQARIDRQAAENAALAEDVRRLTSDPSAIEEIARRELGMIRPGEKVFIVRDLPAPTP